MKRLFYAMGVVLFLFMLAVRAAAVDIMQIYSGRFDNGWGDAKNSTVFFPMVRPCDL